MTSGSLLEKINSKSAAQIFRELYGENEIDSARRRYAALIPGTQDSYFPKTEEPLRIFTAPGRTELAGNHTDHNCGKILAASIQLDCIAIVQKRNDNTVFFRSAGFQDISIKLTDFSGAPDLQPKPEEAGTAKALIRGIAAELRRRGFDTGGFSANAESAVLPGSGLSSSAAVEVLIGRIFDSLYGKGLSALEIARIGQIAENVYFGKPCGLMDQAACSCGGAAAIDFTQTALDKTLDPVIKQINFDISAAGYILCIVNTGGSHADLTSEYASIPAEMKAVAAFFGKSVLAELDRETVFDRAGEVRKSLGDRALLRALHFFDENARVDAMTGVLLKMENNIDKTEKINLFNLYLDLANESGDSSWKLLQNVYPANNPSSQGVAAALAITKDFFRRQKLRGACRVHGGGFAGTIQVIIPADAMNAYNACIEKIFGAGAVTPLRIRPKGAVELVF
ncbi:MAG: galactokinase [Treponema sp.]|nr:galactokinase [Treponema sp.]